MDIFYSKQARKFLEKQETVAEERIKKAVEKLPEGDVVKMSGYDNRYRLRVGGFRIVFTKENGGIYVRIIENRGQVYK